MTPEPACRRGRGCLSRAGTAALALLVLSAFPGPRPATAGCPPEKSALAADEFRSGEEMLERGMPRMAAMHFRAALLACPGHPPSLHGLARAQLALEDYEKALQTARLISREASAPAAAAELLESLSAAFEAERDRVMEIAATVRGQAEEIRRAADRLRPALMLSHARNLRAAGRFREAMAYYEGAIANACPEEELAACLEEYRALGAEIEAAGRERRLISRSEARILAARMALFLEEQGLETPAPGQGEEP